MRQTVLVVLVLCVFVAGWSARAVPAAAGTGNKVINQIGRSVGKAVRPDTPKPHRVVTKNGKQTKEFMNAQQIRKKLDNAKTPKDLDTLLTYLYQFRDPIPMELIQEALRAKARMEAPWWKRPFMDAPPNPAAGFPLMLTGAAAALLLKKLLLGRFFILP